MVPIRMTFAGCSTMAPTPCCSARRRRPTLLGDAGHPERPPVGPDHHDVLLAVAAVPVVAAAAVAVAWLGHGPIVAVGGR